MRSFMGARVDGVRWSKSFLSAPGEQAAARANAELSKRNLVLALSVGVFGCVYWSEASSCSAYFALILPSSLFRPAC